MRLTQKQAKLLRARQLRRELTIAERKAWDIVQDRRLLGFKFRRQHIIHGFIADFYCHELRVVLELDGRGHDDPERRSYDDARTARLEMFGIEVIRLHNSDVCEQMLRKVVQDLSHRSPSPQRGEGDRG